MITISCTAKLHAFALAEQLEKKNMLHKLYTGYYSSKDRFIRGLGAREDREKISHSRVKTYPLLPIIGKYTKKFYEINEIFDFLVSSDISKNEGFKAFIGWSGMSLRSIRKAKDMGKLTIVERGSSHIVHQTKILQEEYKRFGLEFKPDEKTIEKELQEYNEADFISIPSEFVKSSFLEYGFDEKKLIKNPYGADTDIFEADMNCFENSIKSFKVVYVGSLTIQKGLYYMFEALKDIDFPDFEVHYIGHIPNEIKPTLKNYTNTNWKFYGQVNHYELPKLLSEFSVGIHPSLQDGFGMVIPQMLSCGIPVISSTNTGGMDLIDEGKSGFIVPIRSPEAIKEKILMLYEDRDLLRTMKKNAIEMSHNNFTWDQYGQRYEELLSSLI